MNGHVLLHQIMELYTVAGKTLVALPGGDGEFSILRAQIHDLRQTIEHKILVKPETILNSLENK